jgi:PLP dependent protein
MDLSVRAKDKTPLTPDQIAHNTKEIIQSLPPGVFLVAAGKNRTLEEQRAAIAGGASIIGHNYVQEAQESIAAIGHGVCWHCIGHLQRNKAKKASELFDMIETVDSARLGQAIHDACAKTNRIMPVLVELNIAEEPNKFGVFPSDLNPLIQELRQMKHLRLEGLMCMGPATDNPESLRPHFRLAKKLFDPLGMKHLSMGMSDSYHVAIEEGATMVRIGTRLFGPR